MRVTPIQCTTRTSNMQHYAKYRILPHRSWCAHCIGDRSKIETDAFNSYPASSIGKNSLQEREWCQIFIEARERPFAVLLKE